MEFKSLEIEGLYLLKPKVFEDHRGYFFESYNQRKFQSHHITTKFVQDNESRSDYRTLRGLHFQSRHVQAKLVRVIAGEVYDVAVDLRPGSPTYGRWKAVTLTGTNRLQFLIPEGFAHGFQVLSEYAVFAYKCSDYYAPDWDRGILWSDPDLSIDWPLGDPILSLKDQNLPRLRDIDPKTLWQET